jgi:hypothetical protein
MKYISIYSSALLLMLLIAGSINAKNTLRYNFENIREAPVKGAICTGALLAMIFTNVQWNHRIIPFSGILQYKSVVIPLSGLLGGLFGLSVGLFTHMPSCYELVDEEGNVIEAKDDKADNEASLVKSQK